MVTLTALVYFVATEQDVLAGGLFAFTILRQHGCFMPTATADPLRAIFKGIVFAKGLVLPRLGYCSADGHGCQ